VLVAEDWYRVLPFLLGTTELQYCVTTHISHVSAFSNNYEDRTYRQFRSFSKVALTITKEEDFSSISYKTILSIHTASGVLIYGAGVEPSPLRPFIGLLYQSCTIDGDGGGAIIARNQWQGKPKYSGKTCPAPLCPPQTPHDLTQFRTQVATVRSRRLTACATARPASKVIYYDYKIVCYLLMSVASFLFVYFLLFSATHV
jgi:hypothetical protein